MFKRALILGIVSLLAFTTASAQQDPLNFSVPVVVKDSANQNTLYIGISVDGSRATTDAGDTLAPPPPPSGAFDARLMVDGEALFSDIRDTSLTQKTYSMTYQPSDGNAPVRLSWQPDMLIPLGDFYIVDSGTMGDDFMMNMKEDSMLNVANHSSLSDGLSILMTPYGPNEAPNVESSLPDTVMNVGSGPLTFDLSTVFNDPEGDSLRFDATTGDINVATASMENSMVNIYAENQGSTNVTVTANDGKGNETSHSFLLTVNPMLQPDQMVEDRLITVGFSTDLISFDPLFKGGTAPYSYEASINSDSAQVMYANNGDAFSVKGLGAEDVIVSLQVTDALGQTATQEFTVQVTRKTHRFELPLIMSDQQFTDTLNIGMHPGATAMFDESYDEYAPPAPPSGSFDARLLQGGESLFTDTRDSSLTYKWYEVQFAAADGQEPFVVQWDSSIIDYIGHVSIVDSMSDGEVYELDMSSTNQLDMSTVSIQDNFMIRVVPTGANDAPTITQRIPNQKLSPNKDLRWMLNSYIEDPEGYELSFSVESSVDSVVFADAEMGQLNVTTKAPGSSMLTVTASDPFGGTVQMQFMISVVPVDGNGDGTPDSTQSHVASVVAGPTGQPVTLDAEDGQTIESLKNVQNPSESDAPSDVSFPLNFFDFTISGLESGGSTVVTFHLPEGHSVNSYWLYSPTPSNNSPHWFEFLYNDTTGAKMQNNELLVHFVDGKRGDADLEQNGVIEDPGAPAVMGNQPPPKAEIQSPSNNAVIRIQGEPDDSLQVEWTEVQDQDGDDVDYIWKLADHDNLADSSKIDATLQNTSHKVSYHTLDTLFNDLNVAEGDTVQAYHRVNTTDQRSVTKGDVNSVSLIHGSVREMARVQFIHNVASMDSVNLHMTEDQEKIAGPLSLYHGTAFMNVPAGNNVDLYVTASGSQVGSSPVSELAVHTDSVYQYLLTQDNGVTVVGSSGRLDQNTTSSQVMASAVHGVPGQLANSTHKLIKSSDNSVIGTFGSSMSFGSFSPYLDFSPAKVRYNIEEHERVFTFDLSNQGGSLLTFVISDQGDTTITAHAIGADGSFLEPTKATGIKEGDNNSQKPDKFSLKRNYPNPFNPETQIRFDVPKASDVKIDVYNVLGRHITTLIDKKMSAGRHSVTFDGSGLTSGIYLYKMQSPTFTKTRKMLLVK